MLTITLQLDGYTQKITLPATSSAYSLMQVRNWLILGELVETLDEMREIQHDPGYYLDWVNEYTPEQEADDVVYNELATKLRDLFDEWVDAELDRSLPWDAHCVQERDKLGRKLAHASEGWEW